MKWAGSKPPAEVFERGINLGKGAYGSVWEVNPLNYLCLFLEKLIFFVF